MPLLHLQNKILTGQYSLESDIKNKYSIPAYILSGYTFNELVILNDQLKTNPYLAYSKEKNFSIKLCDSIAEKFDLNNKINRTKGYILYSLDRISQSGHCYAFFHQIQSLMKEFDKNIINMCLDQLIDESLIIKYGKDKYYNKNIYFYENNFASFLVNLSNKNLEKTKFVCYKNLSKNYDNLTNKQKKVVDSIEENFLVILTGLPGTGKTTTIKSIVECYGEDNVELFAPTGKACSRITDLCGMQARTIHSTFGSQIYYENKIIIIDEFSMCDIEMSNMIINGIGRNCVLLIVGDKDQLPSVGPGQLLKDLIDSGIGLHYHLNDIMRQKPGSILKSAHSIHSGGNLIIDEDKEIIKYIPKKWDLNNIISKIVSHPEWQDSQFISVLKEKGSSIINPIIKKHLNPSVNGFAIGDKVIQTINNKDLNVFNGEVGTVAGIETKGISVDFSNKYIFYPNSLLVQLDYAYCMTVHKSQGSEFDKVVFIVNKSQITSKNLFYTAITRAKNKLLIVCEDDFYINTVINTPEKNRQTNLKYFLERKFLES